ncbi:MAG: Dabb family protein, partial [Verrucomicrobia bacterium]|nr:Dabb family protein [Verrucomicrobiota bacterium]
VDRLNALNGKVPSLIALDAGLDVIHSDASWDLGLNSTFANLDDLEAYRVHPEHQAVVAIIKEICSARAVVDFVTSN